MIGNGNVPTNFTQTRQLRRTGTHAEFSKDDPDFFKEASSNYQLSPHKVMSRSNLHFLHNYNLIIYNDCRHLSMFTQHQNQV
jgi:hypothetical protein